MIPISGEPLSVEHALSIAEQVEYRQNHFRDEMLYTSIAVILMNYGEQFRELRCINGEWGGVKRDIDASGGIPTCPDGHPIFEEANRVALGWVGEEF